MSSITIINSGDLISGSRTDINTNFANLNADKIETSYLDTDTTLAANSDIKIATQKAVKTYVDANVNPTGRSWNEYATDAVGTDSYAITLSGVSAYVTGQTFKFKAATANTGACTLNINALGAKTIKKNVSTDLATGDILANQDVVVIYDGTNMQLISQQSGLAKLTDIIIPFVSQDVTIINGTQSATAAGGGLWVLTSNTDGSTLFAAEDLDNDATANIYRFQKDTVSGNYYMTHKTTLNTVTSGAIRGIAVVGSFVYVSTIISAANALRRYAIADLSGVTTMSFSGTSRASFAFGDASALYIANGTTDQYDKFTISGTTVTNAGAITYTTSTAVGTQCMISDGTSVWGFDTAGSGTIIIRKWPISGGSATSTTTVIIYANAYLNMSGFCVFIGSSSTLGIGWFFNYTSATAVTGMGLHLMGITLP